MGFFMCNILDFCTGIGRLPAPLVAFSQNGLWKIHAVSARRRAARCRGSCMVQTQEPADHLSVRNFFAARGLLAERIPETTMKTPDFRLLRGVETVAYCEVKSPQDVFTERLHAAIGEVPEGQLAGIIECGYTSRHYRCLERAAKKAAAQFASVNPTHSIPNILMIVNHDAHSYEDDFREVLIGYLDGVRTGKALRDDIPEIDLYVWIDRKSRGQERVAPAIFRHENPLKETVR